MKQLALTLFEGENVEGSFDFTHTTKGNATPGIDKLSRKVYIRRGKKGEVDKGFQIPNDRDYTFVHIPQFNFVGQPSFTLFRLITDDSQMPTENDILLPELNSLPKDRLIEFVENIIRRYENNEFEWDTDTRSHTYTPQLN